MFHHVSRLQISLVAMFAASLLVLGFAAANAQPHPVAVRAVAALHGAA